MNFKKPNRQLKYFDGEEYWETPSLAWIHRIRREIEKERAGRTPRIRSMSEIRKLAKTFGLKVRPLPKIQRIKE